MSSIGASDISSLIPEEVSKEIIKNVTHKSAALSLMRSVRMTRQQQRMPILSALPSASFVAGGGGLKKTTKVAWADKFLNVEEIAAIVPIPEAYLSDSDFDVWGEVQPTIEEAIAIVLDAAVFFGVNKPASWGKAIVTHAGDAGNSIVRAAVSGQDVAGDVSDLMTLVETDGYDVNGHVSKRAFRGGLRNLRDADGNPIFVPSIREGEGSTLWGESLTYIPNDAFDPANADLINGDWKQGILATRQDITMKILTEASLYDEDGELLYNLAQQDMVALRVVARFAYEVANAVNREGDLADQSPFGVLRPVGWTP